MNLLPVCFYLLLGRSAGQESLPPQSEPPSLKTSFTKKEVDRLVVLYRYYGLPIPRQGSELVLIDMTLDGSKQRRYTIALRQPGRTPSKRFLYFGTALLPEKEVSLPEDGQNISVKDTDLRVKRARWGYSISPTEFEANNLLTTAIQLAVLGRRAPALQILPNCFFEIMLPTLTNSWVWTTPEYAVAYIAFQHARNEWLKPGETERARASVILQKIIKAGPFPEQPRFQEEVEHDAKGMRLAMQPRVTSSSKGESLISKILEAKDDRAAEQVNKEIDATEGGKRALEAHRNDGRLVHWATKGTFGTPVLQTVGEVVQKWLDWNALFEPYSLERTYTFGLQPNQPTASRLRRILDISNSSPSGERR